MTIITKRGDLLQAKGVIVHGCNCQRVMGSGVAAQIRKKWPKAYEVYRRMDMELGLVSFAVVEYGVIVANALTQEFYGRDGKVYVDYLAVRQAFATINIVACNEGETVVNFPLIGCGRAGGDWNVVSKIIDQELDDSIEKVLWLQD